MPVSRSITSNSFWPMVVAIAGPTWDATRPCGYLLNLGVRFR